MLARPGKRKIIHLDLVAFCAQVEQQESPALRGQPLVLGPAPYGKGVVADASFEARAHGVHPGMPIKTALQLCPPAVRLDADYAKYRRVAARLHALCLEYTDLVEVVGLDEVYLDATYNKPEIPFGARVAKILQGEIRRQLGLRAAAGLAANKYLAKLASAQAQVGTLVAVDPEGLADFLRDLPVSLIPGVGKIIRSRLDDLGLQTIGQLTVLSRQSLIAQLGLRGAHLWRCAHGQDDDPVIPERTPTQLDQEYAFTAAIYDMEEIIDTLRQLAQPLSARLRRRGLQGRSIAVRMRYADGRSATPTRALTIGIDAADAILRHAQTLLEKTQVQQWGVRSVALELSCFGEEPAEQLDLFEKPSGAQNSNGGPNRSRRCKPD
ncbi:MAG: DNA polymerase IV [Candidatus Latescibacteria bacterium]|nr:DNA polymerase IV [Candidatus Latescibacterota bacterium]